MKKLLKANNLNYFSIRKPQTPPNHFEYIYIPIKYNLENSISKWIHKNLKGRYYVGKSLHLTETNKLNNAIRIGFEDPKELSYFTLACPHLKYY